MDDVWFDMMSDDIKPYLFEWVMTNIAAKLGEEHLWTFNRMVKEHAPQEEFSAYLEKHIPNYTQFLAGVLKKFEVMYVEEVRRGV